MLSSFYNDSRIKRKSLLQENQTTSFNIDEMALDSFCF